MVKFNIFLNEHNGYEFKNTVYVEVKNSHFRKVIANLILTVVEYRLSEWKEKEGQQLIENDSYFNKKV